MMFIAKAVADAKGDVEDKQKFLAALKAVELPESPRGPFKLDDYCNPVENFYVRRVTKVKGKIQNTILQTYPKISQFWKYSPQTVLNEPEYSRDYPPCKSCQENPPTAR